MSTFDPTAVVTGQGLGRPADDLTIIVAGGAVSGWEEIEVKLNLESFPNSFSIALSSPSGAIPAKAGDPCAILLGDDLVITGYVDRDANEGSAGSHVLQLVGRGKTCDLVDCSAEWPSGQLVNGTALDIATKLALPYSIGVELGDGADPGPPIPAPWALNFGETGAEIIQRVAQNASLLAYEDSSGKLILGRVGSDVASSGIVYGQNVQAWSVENSMDGRYSAIVCCAHSMDAYTDFAGSEFFDTEPDPNVPRHRQLDIVLESVALDPQEFTIRKAKWEIARRGGRGTMVTATVDSWRDSAGRLWAPNTMVPVVLPGLRGFDTLCISQVTFRKSSEGGTTADIVAMPPFAFTPAPINLTPTDTAGIVP